jgi:uncharacterized protein YhaN
MKLRNWHIDGFGVFSGAALPEPGLGDGLNLIVGPNEAGKSTLLDFLRYTLFTYPGGGSSSPRREPLNGGNHGGTLTYEVNGEIYNLFRQPGKRDAFYLRNQAGIALSTADLDRHLVGVTSEIFRNIFGFSLEELHGVESFKKAGVRDLIFAASVGQSLGQIQRIEDSLEKQANALFKEGSRSTALNPPRLVKLRSDLSRVRQELAEALESCRIIVEKVKELESEKEVLEKVEIRRHVAEVEIQRLERLLLGWSLWVQRCTAETERNELGDVSGFPLQGDSVLVRLETEYQNTKQHAQTHFEALRVLKEKLRDLPETFPLLKLATFAEELETKRTDYGIAKQLAATEEAKIRDRQQLWRKVSEELGRDWPEEKIRNFDMSLLMEDEVHRLASEIHSAKASVLEKYSLACNFARIARDLSRDFISMRKHLEVASKSLPESREIAQQRVRLEDIREALRTRESLRNDLGRAADHLAQVNLYSGQVRPVHFNVPAWMFIALAIIAFGTCLVSVALFINHQPMTGAISGGFGLGLIVLVVALYLRSRTDGTVGKPLPEVLEAKTRHETTSQAFDEHERHCQEMVAGFAFSWPVSERQLAEREVQIVANERMLNEVSALSKRLAELRAQRMLQNSQFRKAKKDWDLAKAALSLLNQRWSNFLQNRNLPTVQFETAIAVFSRVKEARQLLTELDATNSEFRKQLSKVNSYLAQVRDCLRSAEATISGDAAKDLAEFAKLRQEIVRQQSLDEKRSELTCQLPHLKETFKAAVYTKRQSRRALRELFANAGVSDEQAFRALSERSEKYLKLTQDIRENDTALEVIFGKDSLPQELKEALNPGPRPNWEARKSAIQNEIDSLKVQYEEGIRKSTALEGEIDAEFKSDELARLQLEEGELEEEIRQVLNDWLELATAQELLRRTREKFESENQTPAVAEASRLFKDITGGRYERINVPLDSDDVELTILPAVGPPLTLSELSRGTLEQLYLSIRLGYIKAFQKQQSVSLPLLMDDIAVNFDPQRMKATFGLLSELCRQGQQILFFTCHEQLVKLLRPEDKCFSIKDFQFHREAVGPLLVQAG